MRKILVLLLVFCGFASAQGTAPAWINEAQRDASYPADDWYVGFAQNTLRPEADVAAALKALERDAMNAMVQTISVRISSTSAIERAHQQTTVSGGVDSKSSMDYRQVIETAASAEISGLVLRSHPDREKGIIYALAAVKKSDFAEYCASRAEFLQQRAEIALGEARRLPPSTRKDEALKGVAASLNESHQFLDLLSVVDRESVSLSYLLDREKALRKLIAAKDRVAVYVAGKETRATQGAHKILGGELAKAIDKSEYYAAVDRTGHALDVPVDEKHIKDLGKQLNVPYLCVAEISPSRGGNFYLNVRLINSETLEQRVTVTAESTLEDSKEMMRVSEQLALELMGKENEAKAKEQERIERDLQASRHQALAPVTADSRREEAEQAEQKERDILAAAELLSEDPQRETSEAEKEAAEIMPDEVAADSDPESQPRASKPYDRIMYGGRVGAAFLVAGKQNNSGGGWSKSESKGTHFSAGLTMSIPVTDAISLSPELNFEVRMMDLSLTMTTQEGDQPTTPTTGEITEYALSLPLLARLNISHFFAEAGLRFDYPMDPDILNFAGTTRAQIETAGVFGVGLVLGSSDAVKYHVGYRIESSLTDFDDKNYFRFLRQSIGLTALF